MATSAADNTMMLQDDGPALAAAATASNTTSKPTYIPVAAPGTYFRINSITTLPNNARIIQAGDIILNEPVLQLDPTWQGTPGNCSPQFALKSTVCLYDGSAFPDMYLTGRVSVSNVSLTVKDNGLGMVANSPNGLYLDGVQFTGFGLESTHLLTFGQTDIGTIEDCLFDGSQDGADASWVPLVYFDSYGNSGGYNITNPRLSGRRMFVNDNSNAPGAFSDIRQVNVTDAYDQGASLPILAVQNTGDGAIGTQVYMTAPQIDTSCESAISLSAIPGLGFSQSSVQLDTPVSSGGTVQYVTGNAPVAYYPEGVPLPAGLIDPEAFPAFD